MIEIAQQTEQYVLELWMFAEESLLRRSYGTNAFLTFECFLIRSTVSA